MYHLFLSVFFLKAVFLTAGFSHLVLHKISLIAERYRNGILQLYVWHFKGAVCTQFIFVGEERLVYIGHTWLILSWKWRYLLDGLAGQILRPNPIKHVWGHTWWGIHSLPFPTENHPSELASLTHSYVINLSFHGMCLKHETVSQVRQTWLFFYSRQAITNKNGNKKDWTSIL